jgi:hypothetical protein
VADNQSEWPAQYPGYGWPAADQAPNGAADQGQEQPTEPQVPPAPGAVPPTVQQVAPTVQQVPPTVPQVPPAAYPAPAGYQGYQVQAFPAGYQGYQVPPAGQQVPPAGYQVPPAGYQVPHAGYQVPHAGYQPPHAVHQNRMSASMRAATADRERAVDVLKAGFTEGRLTQDEYNDRMGRAYAARTYGELTALTADLPAGAMPAGAMPAVWPTPAYSPAVSTATNSLARASMILGVAEFFSMGLTAVPAVICGHIAKREMRETGQRGDGMATAGLVLGYMAIVFWGIVIILSILGAAISIAGQGGPVG